jgi:hypothetical protein
MPAKRKEGKGIKIRRKAISQTVMAPKKRKNVTAPKKRKRKRTDANVVAKEEEWVLSADEKEEFDAVYPAKKEVEFDDFTDDEEETLDADYLAKHKSIVPIYDRLQTISDYPLSPVACFAEQRLLVKDGAEELRAEFSSSKSHFHLPKDLIDLCVGYYTETEKMLLERIIDEFQFFADRSIVNRLVTKAAGSLQRLHHLIKAMDRRAPSYVWWFLMRLNLPAFIPLSDLIMQKDSDDKAYHRPKWCLRDGDQSDWHIIVGMLFRQGLLRVDVLHYDVEQRAFYPSVPLMDCLDAIPFPDVIAPCFNTSTVTLEKLKACAAELEARTGPKADTWLRDEHDTWFRRLLTLFKALTAVRLWISDIGSFTEIEGDHGPEWAQIQSMREWNRFHEKYHFGEPFSLMGKNEAKCHWTMGKSGDFHRYC